MKQNALKTSVFLLVMMQILACNQKHQNSQKQYDSAITSEIELLSGIRDVLPEVVLEKETTRPSAW